MKNKTTAGEGQKRGGSTILTLRITPRAVRNEIVGILEDGTIKLHLSAPPVDGKANLMLIRFLAEILGTQTANICIIKGATGRTKWVKIEGMEAAQIKRTILNQIETSNNVVGNLNDYRFNQHR